MGRTRVEFALSTGTPDPTGGPRKTSPTKGSAAGRVEEHPRWRGAGYKEPIWVASHLREGASKSGLQEEQAKHLEEETYPQEEMNEKEWWGRLEKLKHQTLNGKESQNQEIVIKTNYGAHGASVLENFARQLELHYRVYNQGEDSQITVISKSPLPSYRRDLDERPSTKSSPRQSQIFVPAATEHKVENMLASLSDEAAAAPKKRVPNWTLAKASAARLPIRSTKHLALKNKPETEARDLELQAAQRASAKGQAMQAFRETLPAYKLKHKFLKTVDENQVVVVSGDTGCGKTTQLPQFILDKAIEEGKSSHCSIICTQPRRISALSVATRVASERSEPLGSTVGYQLRSESKISPQTSLLFCTTGVLLRRILKDPIMFGVRYIIVDEIHEQGMNEDFLLIVVRELLTNRPDLRLILMSATFNATLFSSYFKDAPMLNIPGFMYPIKDQYLEDVLELTGHILNGSESSCPGDKEWKQMELHNDPLYEIFENVNIEFEYKKYSEATQMSLHSWTGEHIDLHLVEAIIQNICLREEKEPGAILVFLSSWDEISQVVDRLRANVVLKDSSRFLLVPLHGSMPTMDQRQIFHPPPLGVRKIVLATNIVETSITIDDVAYVIDCGKAKESSYDVLNKLACLRPTWIAKSNALQRRGRAGRTREGICYRLYPEVVYNAMSQFQLPEILRTPLPELCLQMKLMHLGSIHPFLRKAIEPPDFTKVEDAIELLRNMGALDDEEELTALGTHLATLPVDPKVGKILILGALFQCLSPALTMAAAIAYQNPFVSMMEHLEEANEARSRFAENHHSDHIATIKAYNGWQEAKHNGAERSYCWDNYLSLSTLCTMEEMRYRFLNILADINFVDKSRNMKAYNKHSQDMEIVKAVLCAGLYPNIVMCKIRNKKLAFYNHFEGRVEPEPASSIAQVDNLPLPWLVYTRTIRGTLYLNDLTNIADYTLLMFGGTLVCPRHDNSAEMLGGFLRFSASKRALKIVAELQRQLTLLLDRKLKNSTQFDIHFKARSLVEAVLELIHSNNTSFKSDGLHGAAWGQEEDHIYSNTNKFPLRRYPSPKKEEGRLGPLDNLFGQLVSIPTDAYT